MVWASIAVGALFCFSVLYSACIMAHRADMQSPEESTENGTDDYDDYYDKTLSGLLEDED